MTLQKKRLALGAVLALALALGGTVLATSIVVNGITLTWPSYPITGPAYDTCEPAMEPAVNKVTLDIPASQAGSSVSLSFAWGPPFTADIMQIIPVNYSNVPAGVLEVPVPYPGDSTQWPVWDQTTNERALAVAVTVRIVSPSGTVTRLTGKKWWVRCLPPPPKAAGCTPGYWKQDQHFDSWTATGLSATDDFNAVFGVTATFNPHTLLDALELNGGGENALARHAVAALLNVLNPDVNYVVDGQVVTSGQIIAWVQDAYATGNFESLKTKLDFSNNAGCPLN